MDKKRFPVIEENLRQALSDLNKLKDKVAAPANVLEKAAYIYRKALECHIVGGRNISTMIGACLYAACVDGSYPITIKEIANASNETEKNIVRYYQTLTYALSLKEIHLDAIASFDKTFKINPKANRHWHDTGIDSRNNNNFKDAVDCFENAINLDELDGGSWYCKGIAYENLRENKKAIACYDKATKINPKDANVWLSKGSLYHEQKNYKKAIACYEKVLKFNGNKNSAWHSVGLIYSEQGNYMEAIECYDKAGRDAYAWNDKGLAYEKLENHKKAIACYDEAIEINPEFGYPWNNKGNIFFNN